MTVLSVDPAWLAKFNRAVPRYTSYPTAPQFQVLSPDAVASRLKECGASDLPLSLYLHIPFCQTMCLFCGCSVVLNRKPEKAASYLALLLEEIRLAATALGAKKEISQLHLGGGTPTSLDERQFEALMLALRTHFSLPQHAEISIEVDPRTVFADKAHKLETLRNLGFNRVSFGVQDLDPRVQEAVKRRQSEEMTRMTYEHARRLGFDGINLDLIYGLPLQTPESFRATARAIADLRPDRIALFSYAKVPWIKAHQKAIREEDLPSTLEKFQMYAETRQTFMEAGYVAIGMDHFALPSDSLAIAYREGTLMRNFQGYSVQSAEDLLNFGITAIGYVGGMYTQNVKTIEEYTACLQAGRLPSFRGFVLEPEDLLRRWVIQEMMCRFRIDKQAFEARYGTPFDRHFATERLALTPLIEDGLVVETDSEIRATPLGELMVRCIASVFDAYLDQGHFSKLI